MLLVAEKLLSHVRNLGHMGRVKLCVFFGLWVLTVEGSCSFSFIFHLGFLSIVKFHDVDVQQNFEQMSILILGKNFSFVLWFAASLPLNLLSCLFSLRNHFHFQWHYLGSHNL